MKKNDHYFKIKKSIYPTGKYKFDYSKIKNSCSSKLNKSQTR